MTQSTTPATADFRTAELSNLKLRLRDDLTLTLQNYGGEACYLVEDLVNSRYHRVGVPEYTFVSLLDGRTTVGEALGRTAVALGRDALTEQQAAVVCRWLVESELAVTDQSASAARLYESAQKKRGGWAKRLNPIFQQFPLGNPDRLLRAATPSVGRLFGPVGLLVWVAVLAVGVYHLFADWGDFTLAARYVVSPGNWLWMVATWLGLKLIHEIAHGVMCVKFGGRVREAGVLLFMGVPMPYVDVTSSWRFKSKWKRIATAAAGMYAELFIAAVAMIVWSYASVGPLKQQCALVILTAGITTLLFNANPLMRFDGYYMLSDWLEAPNLATHGQQYLTAAAKRLMLGVDAKDPNWPEGRTRLIRTYGVAAFLWRILVCVGLLIAAEAVFYGAGVAIAALALVLWLVWPTWRLLRYVAIGTSTEKPRVFRFVLSVTLIAVVVVVAFRSIPNLETVQVPAVVGFADSVGVRASTGGFVTKVHVRPGQEIEAGQTLVVLENPELASKRGELLAGIEKATLRSRKFLHEGKIAAMQVEQQNLVALEKQRTELLEQANGLTIRAPRSGVVIADDLEALLATWATPGQALFTIAGGRREVTALISQSSHDLLKARIGSDVDVRISGAARLRGKIAEIKPRATTRLPHPAFSAAAGGPLVVRTLPTMHTRRKSSLATSPGKQGEEWELLDPHFVATVVLDDADDSSLGAGQIGYVQLRTVQGTIGERMFSSAAQWIRQKRKAAGSL